MNEAPRTPNDGTRVILLDAPTADRAIRRDSRFEVVRVDDIYHALGEIAQNDPESPNTTLVMGGNRLTPDDHAACERAVRAVNGNVRIVAITGEDEPRRDGETLRISEQHLPDAITADPPAAPAQTVISPLSPSAKKPKKNKKKNKDKKKRTAPGARAFDERVLLKMILTGGDPLSEVVHRVADALGTDRVEFIRANGADAPPTLADGFTVAKVARRSHTFGWLVGPTELTIPLKDQAETMALWLSLADQHGQLRALAFTDSLTGAWNRRYFDKYLASALTEARNKRHSLTLMVFDIDNFKHYNDVYGHAAGDEILIETIRLLKAQVRPNDKVCRIGGDEFAVVFYDPAGPRDPASNHPRSIFQLACRFQKAIANHNFPKLAESAKGSLTISGGLATFPWDAHGPEQLLERADHLALVSKKQGKNVLTIGEMGQDEPAEDNGIDLPDTTKDRTSS